LEEGLLDKAAAMVEESERKLRAEFVQGVNRLGSAVLAASPESTKEPRQTDSSSAPLAGSPSQSLRGSMRNTALGKINEDCGLELVDRTGIPISFLGGVGMQRGKYKGMCEGPDGKLYCAPYHTSRVLIIDPKQGKLTAIDGAGQEPDKWSSRTSVEKEFLEAATRKTLHGEVYAKARCLYCSRQPRA